MCDTVLAIGEKDSFHFECPSRWVHDNLPDDIADLFKQNVVATTYHMSLGFQGGYIFSYRNKAGENRLVSRSIPEGLRTWLYEKDSDGDCVRNFSKIYVTLGPSGSYWATDGGTFEWEGLPSDLAKAISSLRVDNGNFSNTNCPRLVTLGFGGDYLMLTKGNGYNYSLSNNKELAAQMLGFKEKEGWNLIVNLSLSPHKADCSAGVLTTGYSYSEGMAPSAKAQLELIDKAIKEDTAVWKHEQKLQDMRDTEREIELMNQATRLADQQTMRSAATIDFFCGFEYTCDTCHLNTRYCTCGSIF